MPRPSKAALDNEAAQEQELASQLNDLIDGLIADTPVAEAFDNMLPADDYDRSKVLPPPSPVKDKSNPDGILDIIAFSEHPYFLNQPLTPWQKVILKIFYMGTPGNTHLKITDEVTNDCSGCIWHFNFLHEKKHCEALINNQLPIPDPKLKSENSPCVTCTRFPDAYRKARYDHLIDLALTNEQKEIEITKSERELVNNFWHEMDLIQKSDLLPEVKEQILKKCRLKFFELVLVLGRRSGKSFLVCIIALYEVYKLIMMGHPQKRIPSATDSTVFTICNVAVSATQAEAAIFNPLSSYVNSSPFFTQWVGGQNSLEIHFLTPHDKEENAKRQKKKLPLTSGTVQIVCGHSNSASLVGRSMIVVIIDEMGEMASNGGNGVDYELYEKLRPAIASFGLDYGKLICISNPLGPQGKLYDLYKDSFSDNTMLMFQLATWQANPFIPKDFLDAAQKKNPVTFDMFYGARFGDAGSHPWIPPEYVDAAFEEGFSRARVDIDKSSGIAYYAHLDPAKNHDYYVLAVVHPENTGFYHPDGEPVVKIIVDHIHYWKPVKGTKIDADAVDNYIINLSQKMYLKQISYDQWDSENSIKKLKGFGLNAVQTTFNPDYKRKVYGELYELFTSNRIHFYGIPSTYTDPSGKVMEMDEVALAKKQFKLLQKKVQANNLKIYSLPNEHDDIPDAVAGACYQALQKSVYHKPFRPRAVSLPYRMGRF